MKRVIGLLCIFISLFIFDISLINAQSQKNLVNIYFFHSNTCPHCKEELNLLNELEAKYDNIKIYKYEINTDNNGQLLLDVAELFDTNVTGTPFTVIGDKVYKGFSYENSKSKFIRSIEYYSDNGYQDKVGEYIGNIELPTYPIGKDKSGEDSKTIDEYINEKEDYKLNIPLIGTVQLKSFTLPVISILIGLVDGFNPCAMWVLLFLISMLIGMNDKKRMWIMGFTFLLTSGLIYLLFMVAWLNAATLLLSINWVRLLIGIVAIIGSIINLRSYVIHRKDNGCDVIDDKKRNKIFDRIKKFTHEKNFFIAIIGVMALAISVNIVELACSAGLPVMFIEILSMNNLNIIEQIVYIALYMLFFLLDDFIVFFIAMRTMQLTGFSTKYGKLSKLIGGILLLLIGLLLIFKPEWLMFNF